MFHRSVNLITLSPNRNMEKWKRRTLNELCCSVVVQSNCVWLFVIPWTVGHQASLSFIISQCLFKFMSIKSRMPSSHLILFCPFLLLPKSFTASGSFPMSWRFTSDNQTIGASASVLPMIIQGWFPLGLTGFISFLSKRLSRVFSSTTNWKHQLFGA